MERHYDNTEKLAAYLSIHDKVEWVNNAAIPDS